MSLHSTSTSSSSLLSYLSQTCQTPPLTQDQHTPTPHDLEKASAPHDASPKRRLCPYAAAPSIFKILTIGILFLGITAVVAGMVSGDWEASVCVIAMLLILEAWIWVEELKFQELKRGRYSYRGRSLGWGLGVSGREMNRLLYAWARIGDDEALLG